MGQTRCHAAQGKQMQCCDQSQSIDMQCTTQPSLPSLERWRGDWCLFFDQSEHHHGNLPWRGELASPRLAYLTLPIPSPLICFGGFRNALGGHKTLPEEQASANVSSRER